MGRGPNRAHAPVSGLRMVRCGPLAYALADTVGIPWRMLLELGHSPLGSPVPVGNFAWWETTARFLHGYSLVF
jgi:hypothetical protein